MTFVLNFLICFGLTFLMLINGYWQIRSTQHNSASVKDLIIKLKKGDCESKLLAMSELQNLKGKAQPAVETLIKILEDDKAIIPGAAAAAAQQIIPRKEDANSIIRASSAETLAWIGPGAKPAIPALISNLKDKDKFIRASCAVALSSIGVKDRKILSALNKAMTDDSEHINRVEIAASLAKLDPESEEAIKTITKVLLKGVDSGARCWAALTLRDCNSSKIKKAIPSLIIALKDKEHTVRESAAEALGGICEESATVVPALIERLCDKSVSVRVFSAQSLGEYGPEAKSAIPALRRALKDSNKDVRVYAAQALEHIKTWTKKRGRKGIKEHAEETRKQEKDFEER